MNKEEFVALCTEEGLSTTEADFIWDGRPNDDLSADAVRHAARKTFPVAKVFRELIAQHVCGAQGFSVGLGDACPACDKVYCRVHGLEPCRCDGRHLTEKGGES